MHPATSAAEGFDPKRAVATIDRATMHDATLRRRTEALSWIVWGFVGGAVLLGVEASGAAHWVLVLGVWPVAGVIAISLAWEIAAFGRPALRMRRRNVARLAAVAVAGVTLVMSAGYGAWRLWGTYLGIPLGVVAVPWIVLAAAQWDRMTSGGRRLTVVGGVVLVALALAYASRMATTPAWLDVPAVSAAVVLVPFVLGIVHSFRDASRTVAIVPPESSPSAAEGDAAFDLATAVRTIDRATGYDAPLRRRTEGVAWMVWGLAAAVVVQAYASLEAYVPSWWYVAAIVILGWPVLGLGGAALAWRVASVTEHRLGMSRRAFLLRTVAIAAVVLVVVEVNWFLGGGEGAASTGIVVMSVVPWLLFAAFHWRRMSDGGRRASLAIAIATALAVTVAVVVLPGDPADAKWALPLFLSTVAGIPVVAGALRAARG